MNTIRTLSIVALFASAFCQFDVVFITDVHLDLLFNASKGVSTFCENTNPFTSRGSSSDNPKIISAPYGRHGCDTPYSLFISALTKLSELKPNPSLVICAGDLVSHGIPAWHNSTFNATIWELLQNTTANMTQTIYQYFGDAPIIFTFGNDDTTNDYEVPDESFKEEFYSFYYQQWFLNIKTNKKIGDNKANQKTFMDGGYYYMDINDNLRVISINSLYFGNLNPLSQDPSVPLDQLAFLNKTLSSLGDSQKAIIVFHIPNIPYFGYGAGHKYGIQYAWNSSYEEIFRYTCFEFRDKIIIVYGAHFHRTIYRVDAMPYQKYQGSVEDDLLFNSLIITRAVSPVFENEPGITYMEFTLNNTDYIPKKLVEYTFPLEKTYNTFNADDTSLWEFLYDSEETLGIVDFTRPNLQKFLQSLGTNPSLMLKFGRFKFGFEA